MRNKLNKFLNLNISPFSLKREFQEKLLNEFSEPTDAIERSFFQYKIQAQLNSKSKIIVNNIFSFFALLYLFGLLLFKKVFYTQSFVLGKKRAVFPYKNLNYQDIIPIELENEFEILSINFNEDLYLNKNDFLFLLKIIYRYPFNTYFVFKCTYKIAFYSYIIQKFSPQAIIGSSEYSFTCSIATDYCRNIFVEHINIMHGEKLFYIRDSFVEFDRFFVWDEHYKRLFLSLRADKNQFRIGTVRSLMIVNTIDKIAPLYDYTYYLAAENFETLIRIKDTLLKLGATRKIAIRMHPRYSDEKLLTEIFQDFYLENPKETSLELSFNSTNSIISLYSTVLIQAVLNNKCIIIDDVNNDCDKIRSLQEADFIVFSKKHKLLSKII